MNQVSCTHEGLAYCQNGPESGLVLLAFHGLPGSSLDFQPTHDLLHRHNIRLISFDRPGYGGSSPLPGYTLTDLSKKVVNLLDALAIQRLHVLGFSGGAPHALALAKQIPERIQALHIFSGLTPLDGRLLAELPEASQGLFQMAAKDVEETVTQLAAMIPSSDALLTVFESLVAEVDCSLFQQPEFRSAYGASFARAMAQGLSGMAEDLRVCAQPWGFELDEIGVPTDVWQGTADLNTPPVLAHYLAEHIPDSRLRMEDGAGHYLLMQTWPEFLQGLAAEV